jgi:hypothetical protein
MRSTPIALLLLIAAGACQAPPPEGATGTPDRSFDPGYPLSGRVVQLVPGGIIVDSGDRQIQLSFGTMVDVWRETSVPKAALEVGDEVFIADGHVFANIGRVDGVIREIDATGLVVDLQIRSGGSATRRIDFSAYIEYGYAGGAILKRDDLVAGRAIGAVIYGRAGGPLRATRIW